MTTLKSKHVAVPSFSFWDSERMTGAGILFCAFLVMGYGIWILDRGFEMTDEAYYLLLAIQAHSQQVYISAQHWITSWLWQITGSLAMFRASGLLTLLLSSILLALGAFAACLHLNILKETIQSKLVVVAASIIGAMLYAATINLSPSYNLLASAGAYAAAGLALLGICWQNKRQNQNNSIKYACHFLAGCAVCVEALCKASAGLSTLVILIMWIGLLERGYVQQMCIAAAIAAGVIVFAGIALFTNTTFGDATQAFETGMQLFKIVQVESIDARLTRYAFQFWQNILATGIAFGVPILLFSGYLITRRPFLAKGGAAVLLVTLVLGRYFIGGWNDGQALDAPIALFAMLILALMVSIPVWTKNRQSLAVFGGLILVPYSVAMGTGNTLFTQAVVSLAPWSVLIALLAMALFPKERSKMPVLFVAFCFMATVSSQIITSGWRPYHMTAPLIQQDQPIPIGNLGAVKVDAETRQFIVDLQAAARYCNLVPGLPFLGLYNIPGVALVLDAAPVMSPWLNNLDQAEFVLERTQSDRLSSQIVALNLNGENRTDFPPLPKQLKNFPSGYMVCGMATYPFGSQKIQIWKSVAK